MPLEPVQTLEGHTDRVWTLEWNPQGTVLASSGCDKTIRLWAKENEKWNCVALLTEAHTKTIRRICWSPCGSFIASASFDSSICIWKKNPNDLSWNTTVNLEGHESEVKSVAWSHDGKYLASCGRDRSVWIWERAPEEDSQEEQGEGSADAWDCSDVKNDHSKDVKHIVWHPSANILASCSFDDTIKLFHKADDDWKCFQTLSSHSSTVWSADFSKSGEYLATCSDDKTVRIWKNHAHDKLPEVVGNSWKCVSVIQGYHSRTIYDVSWHAESDVIASASGDNSLAFYSPTENQAQDQSEFECIEKFGQAHSCDVNAVAWNQKSSGLLATASDDNLVKIWNFTKQEKGMTPKTIFNELMASLKQTPDNSSADNSVVDTSTTKINVKNYNHLQNLIQSFQQLQSEVHTDEDHQLIREYVSIDIRNSRQNMVEMNSLILDSKDESVTSFNVVIKDTSGKLEHNFTLDFENFKLFLPRRSLKCLIISNEIFLIEKTGDLYKILPDGHCKFLLGHLYTLTDVEFIKKSSNKGHLISHILSADRDEKIRVSSYPDTYNIETFCVGHKAFVRRLIALDDDRFISLDQENMMCLWNLGNLKNADYSGPIRPEKSFKIGESEPKRKCVARRT